MRELTEAQKSYMAGFLDGDGNISIEGARIGAKHQSWALSICYYNCNIEVLEKIQSWLGTGSIYERKRTSKWRINYRLKVRGVSARDVLAEIFPYLIVKREQASVAMEFAKTFTKYNYSGSSWQGGRKLTEITIKKRNKLKDRLHELTLTANYVGRK